MVSLKNRIQTLFYGPHSFPMPSDNNNEKINKWNKKNRWRYEIEPKSAGTIVCLCFFFSLSVFFVSFNLCMGIHLKGRVIRFGVVCARVWDLSATFVLLLLFYFLLFRMWTQLLIQTKYIAVFIRVYLALTPRLFAVIIFFFLCLNLVSVSFETKRRSRVVDDCSFHRSFDGQSHK